MTDQFLRTRIVCAVAWLVGILARVVRGLTRIARHAHRLKPAPLDPAKWRLRARRHETTSGERFIRVSLYEARRSRNAGAILLELCRREPLPGGGIRFVPMYSQVYKLLGLERTDHQTLFDLSIGMVSKVLRESPSDVPDAVLWEG